MTKDRKKTKTRSPAIFFAVVVLVIVTVMFVANKRSALEQELSFPLNNGVARLSSHAGHLVAACHDNTVYIWDWDDLSKAPRQCVTDSDQAVLYDSDTLVSMSRTAPRAVSLFKVTDGTVTEKVWLSQGDRGYLLANRDRSVIAVLLSESVKRTVAKEVYRLRQVDFEKQATSLIATFETEDLTSRVMDAAVSDDGSFVVAVGEIDQHGWLFGIDVAAKAVAWNREVEDLRQIVKADFGGKGSTIYARGSDSTLLLIDRASGEISERLQPGKENESTYRIQAIQDVDVSPDGRFVAAIVGGVVYTWDCRKHRVVYEGDSGHKLISSIAFSSDSQFMATSDARQGGRIRVLVCPD